MANREEVLDGGMRLVLTVDTEWGEAWVVVGVPQHMQGTAKAAGTTKNLVRVEPFGDSLETWCPKGAKPAEVMQAVAVEAKKAWEDFEQEYEPWMVCSKCDRWIVEEVVRVLINGGWSRCECGKALPEPSEEWMEANGWNVEDDDE